MIQLPRKRQFLLPRRQRGFLLNPYRFGVGGGGTPVIQSFATSIQTADTTSHPINMPSGIVAGDTLLLVFSKNGGAAPTTPAGWSIVEAQADSSSAFHLTVFKKTAAGGDTVTVTTAAERSAAVCMRVSPATAVYASKTTQAATNAPDCPSLSPGIGAVPFLWLACYSAFADNMVSVAPSGYTIVGAVNSTVGSSGASCSVCEKTSTASSEDPGTATSGATARRQALITLGVKD